MTLIDQTRPHGAQMDRRALPRQPRAGRQQNGAQTLAKALGWFSLALGAAELLAPGAIGRSVGLTRRRGPTASYGPRETGSGSGAGRIGAPGLMLAAVAGVMLTDMYAAAKARQDERA